MIDELCPADCATPASYYPGDARIVASIDVGIRDVAALLGKPLQDFPGQQSYAMLDRLPFKALPTAHPGPAFSYSDLARLPLLNGLKVRSQQI